MKSRTHVLLINPPNPRFDRTLDYLQAEFASVAAYLQKIPDIALTVIPAGLLNVPSKVVIKEMVSNLPQVVIIFMDVCEAQAGMRIAFECKSILPESKVVAFGDATVWIPQYFERFPFDAVVISGDQELVLADYIISIQNGTPPVHGVSFQNGDNFQRTAQGQHLTPADWPFPLEGVIDRDSYDFARKQKGEPTNDLSFTISKGCKVGCVWCIDPYKNGRKDRRRPVIQTIDFMQANLGRFDIFQLHSPIFTHDREWVDQFILELKQRNLHIPFKFVTLVGEMADPKLVEGLADVGLKSVGMGVETLSLRRAFTKKYNEDLLPDVAYNLKLNGVKGICYTQIGLDGQTREDIYYTHWKLLDLGFQVRPTGATPFHKLVRMSVADLDNTDLTSYDRKSFYNPKCGITKREFYSLLLDPYGIDYSELLASTYL